MNKIFYILLASTVLSLAGCTSISNSVNSALGIPVAQQTQDYTITDAGGIFAKAMPKSATHSSYRYTFSIDLKTAEYVRSVKIERLNKDGSKSLIIDDSANPTRKQDWQPQQPNNAQSRLINKTWVGQSQNYNMTPEQAPWLYQAKTTYETYLFTITDLNGKVTTLKQSTRIPSAVKVVYLQIITP